MGGFSRNARSDATTRDGHPADAGASRPIRVDVPVRHPDGAVLGAVTVSGPVYRLSDERFREELPEILKSVANEIRLNLSY